MAYLEAPLYNFNPFSYPHPPVIRCTATLSHTLLLTCGSHYHHPHHPLPFFSLVSVVCLFDDISMLVRSSFVLSTMHFYTFMPVLHCHACVAFGFIIFSGEVGRPVSLS